MVLALCGGRKYEAAGLGVGVVQDLLDHCSAPRLVLFARALSLVTLEREVHFTTPGRLFEEVLEAYFHRAAAGAVFVSGAVVVAAELQKGSVAIARVLKVEVDPCVDAKLKHLRALELLVLLAGLLAIVATYS